MKQKIRAWAPYHHQVEALVDGMRIALEPEPRWDGWWTSRNPYPPGTRYSFFLEKEGPFPDPRSPFQPEGIHGPSQIIDHAARHWADDNWKPPAWERAVVYEMHVGTFSESGTFRGAIGHLEELVDLGVTHVELMPVCEFSGTRGWGYDGVDIFAPHREYGGVEELKGLIEHCHELGLAVIIDVVYNHMGPAGNYLPKFGPYFTERHPTPWGAGPNLDGSNSAEVRRFFIDNTLMWLRDYHADGVRLDAIDKVVDESVKHFLLELREEVDLLAKVTGIPRVLVAESAENCNRYVRKPAERGYGMDAQWNDDFHHSMRTFFTGESDHYYMDYGDISHLAKALRQGFVYDGCHSKFRGKPHGTSPEGLAGRQFLAYLQTHDQIGNRAQGDRFHHHPKVSLLHQKIAAAFVLLGPFVPMIFMGEEWAAATPFQYFTDHGDPELAKAVRLGRKAEFGRAGWNPDEIPDPQDPRCFEASRLRREERELQEHADMLWWYRELLSKRHSNPALQCSSGPGAEVGFDPHGAWLWMRRGEFFVIACFVSRGTSIPIALRPGAEVVAATGGGAGAIVNAGKDIVFSESGVTVIRNSYEGTPDLSEC